MPSLAKELRGKLASVTLAARTRAEAATKAALENLAVHERQAWGHMDQAKKDLRTKLRARGKALGDARADDGSQALTHLVEAAAYEQWHRLLFTRFLTENDLLHTDEENGDVSVSLQECDELAADLGARDGFDLACRFASRSLPGVFRSDDPVLALRLALNDEVELRGLLDKLPTDVFTASDSLGWTYQFWQAQRKDDVNDSGKKIGADELPSVTQLFTEDYMVDFLLDNTLGAWWAGKQLALNPQLSALNSEIELRQAVALPGCPWSYLRWVKGKDGKWTPAAGMFDGWPRTAAALRALDPCMGSGHFVVAIFERLVALRVAEEKLAEAAAVAAVIRDNLFGLEIDPRCTQIGAFNLALAAWRRVGHCKLPAMNLACSGLAPNAKLEDWLKVAVSQPSTLNSQPSDRLRSGMERLYQLFRQAPVLGSLINPRAGEGDLLVAAFHELQPLLEKALAQETKDDTAHEMAVTARGLAKAAEILAGQFTLVATNVPYLGRGKHDEMLMQYCDRVHPNTKADIATCFVERCLQFAAQGGCNALVTPQSWWFSTTYTKFRGGFLKSFQIDFGATLGEEAWQAFGNRGPMAVLMVLTARVPEGDHQMSAIDAQPLPTIAEKMSELESGALRRLSQLAQISNPDSRIALVESQGTKLLQHYSDGVHGLGTKDSQRFIAKFWEIQKHKPNWEFMQGSVLETTFYGGMDSVVFWEQGKGILYERGKAGEAVLAGGMAHGKAGVLVSQVRNLKCTIYFEGLFEKSAAVVSLHDRSILPAVWSYCSSGDFTKEVRRIDQKVVVTNNTLVKVPFDLAHWQKVAAEKYPHGLPKPFSSDPTQWLFNGHPTGADQPLHVAVARLLGYQWPRLTGSSFPDCPALGPDGLEKLADEDGIVCLPPLNREAPAAQRVRELLAKALGKFDERALLTKAGLKGSKSTTLEDWLRDECFEQHCELFHHRPFLWHIWDGRKDGFHALVHYHRLDHATLNKLAFSYLGTWITDQAADAKAEKPGADARLGAAQALQNQLKAILDGEAPYDLFVRWKPLSKQAKGWHPDLNDGVRMNIRPFASADIFRKRVKIKWDKDRGTEPQRDKTEYPWFWCQEEPGSDPKPDKEFAGNRWNNVHLSLATKRKANT